MPRLSKYLALHKSTLETLSIELEGSMWMGPSYRVPLGSLREYKNLRHVELPHLFLLGQARDSFSDDTVEKHNENYIPRRGPHLIDVLPQSLCTLVLWFATPVIIPEIISLIDHRSMFPYLRRIAVRILSGTEYEYYLNKDELRALKKYVTESGIEFNPRSLEFPWRHSTLSSREHVWRVENTNQV